VPVDVTEVVADVDAVVVADDETELVGDVVPVDDTLVVGVVVMVS
jgi:hypothetical protein